MKNYSWHQKCWQHLAKSKQSQQLPHAVLLTGEEGIAKYALARRLAKSLVCINSFRLGEDACDQCQSCKTFESGANPDFAEIGLIDDKQQIGVDQIRGLTDFLNYSRSYNTFRVVIINPVEKMNVNAANSLLKSLEEPTPNTVLILVTSKVGQLLATIKSRCQSFSVASPSKKESIDWLMKNVKNNDLSLPVLEGLVDLLGNKPLKILNLNHDDIESRGKFCQDLLFVVQERMTVVEMAKKWEKNDLELMLDWQIAMIQKSIKSLMCDIEPQEEKTVSDHLTQRMSLDRQWSLYQDLIKQKPYIHTSVNPLMFIENMLISWLK